MGNFSGPPCNAFLFCRFVCWRFANAIARHHAARVKNTLNAVDTLRANDALGALCGFGAALKQRPYCARFAFHAQDRCRERAFLRPTEPCRATNANDTKKPPLEKVAFGNDNLRSLPRFSAEVNFDSAQARDAPCCRRTARLCLFLGNYMVLGMVRISCIEILLCQVEFYLRRSKRKLGAIHRRDLPCRTSWPRHYRADLFAEHSAADSNSAHRNALITSTRAVRFSQRSENLCIRWGYPIPCRRKGLDGGMCWITPCAANHVDGSPQPSRSPTRNTSCKRWAPGG